MSDVTKTGIELVLGPNDKREPGRVHEELHAPCGCAFHQRPAPHWHPCPAHTMESDAKLLEEVYEWLFESRADGPRVSEGALTNGSYTPEFLDLHKRLAARLGKTT